MTGLNILALVMSLILTWHQIMGGTMAGCGSGSPCEQVISSRWALVAGIIPSSGLAIGVYLALLVAGFFSLPGNEYSIRRLAWSIMLILAGAVAGSAIWLTIVQKWIIGAFCPYCMTTHISGFLLAVFIIWQASKAGKEGHDDKHPSDRSDALREQVTGSGRMFRPYAISVLVLSGMVLSGILPLSQSGYKPPAVYNSRESQDIIPVLDYHKSPVIGSPDAPEKVIIMFDYQCSHCQQLHFMLDMVIDRFEGKLAFALCPVPLDPACNRFVPEGSVAFRNSCELARIGLAVWRADPVAFKAFQDYMFTFESGDRWRPRSPADAMAKAVELTGRQKFDTAWTDPWLDEYLQTCVSIFGSTLKDGRGGIPKMLYGTRWVISDAMNAGELEMILRGSLGLSLQ